MRVALFHDYFGSIGGGERLVLTLGRALNAPVYTTDVHRPSIERLGFGDVTVRSLGSNAPMPPLKQVHASLRFALARADGYDAYVLSGNWAPYAARRHHPNLLYCHTPVRAFYDLREVMLSQQQGTMRRWAARAWVTFHSAGDRLAMASVDRVVTNSENTRHRIARYLGREARVVHPPTDVNRYRFKEVGDFWLSVNRLYPEKQVDLQLEIFRRLPEERLVIVGGYSRGDHAEAHARVLQPPPNVEFKGEVAEEELVDLYARCRGLICTARDEDFGMTPVEAMAAGKVVLAVDGGGFRETVVPGETGWLLPTNVDAFAAKIRALRSENLAAYADACRRRALRFDTRRFVEEMRELLRAAAA